MSEPRVREDQYELVRQLLSLAIRVERATYAVDASCRNPQFDQLSFAVFLARNITREVEHFAEFLQVDAD